MSEIYKYTAEDLKAENLKARGTVMVDFWASWCGPCRMLAPSVEKIADEYAGKITVAKVNIDDEADAAIAMGVASIPTLVVFRDGVEVDRSVGALPYPALKDFIENNL